MCCLSLLSDKMKNNFSIRYVACQIASDSLQLTSVNLMPVKIYNFRF